ncbi:MAG: HAMP domain-containing protein, partial [Planctomycetes bacterium]|nr:HAMP domain-containing protein [Planctomycetota bacterium]
MTIRRKLDITLLALIAVFLAAGVLSLWTVGKNAEETRRYAWMREQSQFTADVRTHIYQRLARPVEPLGLTAHQPDSPQPVLDDLTVQINLAVSERERELWQAVHACVDELASAQASEAADASAVQAIVQRAEKHLRELRDYYDLDQYQSIARTARASLMAQVAISVAALLTVVLLIVQMVVVRKWLVAPIEVLKNSAETIGKGRLDHRVPLAGNDELAQLARSIDTMARNLAQHQTALLAARELSALGELCANVAHGLKNPLAALKTTAQLAERQAANSSELAGLIHEMTQQVDRLNQRIVRLFEFSRPLELRPSSTSFRDLAAAAQAQAAPSLRSRGLTLQIDDRTRDRTWRLDVDQLGQALAEL